MRLLPLFDVNPAVRGGRVEGRVEARFNILSHSRKAGFLLNDLVLLCFVCLITQYQSETLLGRILAL